jgi:subtilisin family serine protease
MIKKASFVLLATALAASAALAQGRPELVTASLADPARKFVPYQVLVQFRAGADSLAQDAALRQVGGRKDHTVLAAAGRRDGKGDLHLVNLPPGMTVATAVRNLTQTADVDFVEPNWIYQHQDITNDPLYTNGSLWGMYPGLPLNTGDRYNFFGTGAGGAWANGKTDCSGVYVGIIDEGYMYTHPDLAANAGGNPGEIAGNGIDDDGNGLVDDVYGWDFDGNNNTVFDGADDDHGTHVAGTIGAAGNNGIGVAGMCWKVKLLDAKFLGKRGGTTANAIKAVDYFTALKTRTVNPVPIAVTNNSWGGGGFSQALADAIERANAADILFVAAAGNDGADNDASPHYPSSYSNANIIAVAAITSTGALSSFSNYGATTVDIGAPGSGIWSTVPVRSGKNVVPGYAAYSGTSMAAPHVTGAVALYKAYYSNATAAQIKQVILFGTATPTNSLTGKTVTGGRLNVSGI